MKETNIQLDAKIPPLSSLTSTLAYFVFCHFRAIYLAPRHSFFSCFFCSWLYSCHQAFQTSQDLRQMSNARKPEKVLWKNNELHWRNSKTTYLYTGVWGFYTKDWFKLEQGYRTWRAAHTSRESGCSWQFWAFTWSAINRTASTVASPPCLPSFVKIDFIVELQSLLLKYTFNSSILEIHEFS